MVNYLRLKLADIFHKIGCIYLCLQNPAEALLYYRKGSTYSILLLEYFISKEKRFFTILSRAIGEIGRICVKTKKYKEAINAFNEKLNFCQEFPTEKAWLFHDIGRCYLEIRDYEKAIDFGQRSSSIADDIKDQRWGMNSRLLIAQAYCNNLKFLTVNSKKKRVSTIRRSV